MFICKKKAESIIAQLTFRGYSENITEDVVGSYIFEAFDSSKSKEYRELLEKARRYVRFNLIGKTVGELNVQDVYSMIDYNPNNDVHRAMFDALKTIILETRKIDKNVSILSLVANMFFTQI